MRALRRGALSSAVFLLSFPLFAETQVSGKILDTRTSRGAPDARVIILETKQSSHSDAEGAFSISVPSPGYYTFRILYEGKVLQQRKEVRYSGEMLLFYATPEESSTQTVTQGHGITITGYADRTRLSRFALSNEEIRRLPGAYGDSLKAIQTLPGIAPAQPIGALPSSNILPNSFLSGFGLAPPYRNSIAGNLVIRGAGSRSSNFFLDGFKIQYPFHLGDQSSVLNNDFIRNIDVYTGTYPARFGNATGGVISIEGPKEAKQRVSHINVALFLTDAYTEAPLINENGYIVAAARQSYPNYTLLHLYPDAIPPNAKYALYNDGQIKAGYRFNANHEISAIYFGSHDVIKYTKSVSDASNSTYAGSSGVAGISVPSLNTQDANSAGRPPVGLNRSFDTGGLRYISRYGTGFQNTLTAQVSRFHESFELDFRSPFTGETIFGFEELNARQEIQYKDEMILQIIKEHLIILGGVESNQNRWELSLRNFSQSKTVNPNTPGFVDTINQLVDSNRTFRALYDGDRTNYNLNSGYLEMDIDIWRLRFTPGVRAEQYSLSRSIGVGPRMGMEFNIPETKTSFMAAAGRHFGVPPSQEMISIEAGNPDLKMEQADRAAIGINQEFSGDWLLKIEGFRNIFSNIVVEDRFEYATFQPRTNRRDLAEKSADIMANPLESRNVNYSNDGTGYSQGAEIYLKKSRRPGAHGVFFWVSYTYSITKRNNHQTRMTQDETNALNTRNLNRTVLAQGNIGKNKILYYNTGEVEYYPDNDRNELYDYDRTHILNFVGSYRFNANWQIGGRWRYATSPPYTPITSADNTGGLGGILTFIPKYSNFYNSARFLPYHQLDVRLDYFMNYEWGYANIYLELINFYGRRNAEQENFNFLRPYNFGSNPATSYESTYIQTPTGGGRTLLLPLINLGMELKF